MHNETPTQAVIAGYRLIDTQTGESVRWAPNHPNSIRAIHRAAARKNADCGSARYEVREITQDAAALAKAGA